LSSSPSIRNLVGLQAIFLSSTYEKEKAPVATGAQ
jgi:hypothetical protein